MTTSIRGQELVAEISHHIRFLLQGAPCALGFEFDVSTIKHGCLG